MPVKRDVAIAVGLLPALLVTSAWAHHAFSAEFDANKPVKFEGATVVKMEWVNPHAWIYIDVPAAGGKVERWAIEAGTPNVALPPRLHEAVARAGNQDRRRWLPGQGRDEAGQRPQSHVP